MVLAKGFKSGAASPDRLAALQREIKAWESGKVSSPVQALQRLEWLIHKVEHLPIAKSVAQENPRPVTPFNIPSLSQQVRESGQNVLEELKQEIGLLERGAVDDEEAALERLRILTDLVEKQTEWMRWQKVKADQRKSAVTTKWGEAQKESQPDQTVMQIRLKAEDTAAAGDLGQLS